MASTRRQTRSSKQAAAGNGKQVAEGSAAQGVKRRRGSAAASAPTTIDALPADVLMLVFKRLGFPHRFTAALVCRLWRDLATDACFTHRATGSINDAIRAAGPGDTLIIPSGFYTETILVDKPLRIIGEQMPNLWGQPRRSVVLQSRQSMVVLCDARTCLESVTLRTIVSSENRSIVAFGPNCSYICLDNCDLAGYSGLLIPGRKGPDTQLVLRQCSVHSVIHPIPAIAIDAGHATLTGCTIYRNDMAIECLRDARIDISNCDISFNRRALELDGSGTVTSCIFWGNEQMLHFAASELAVDGVDGAGAAASQPQASAADQQAAPHAGAAAVLRAARARAGGIVFSGNHVRTNQHAGAEPADGATLRRQTRRLMKQVYGSHAPDYDDWEVLGESDLDTDLSSDDELPGIDSDSGSSSDGSDLSLTDSSALELLFHSSSSSDSFTSGSSFDSGDSLNNGESSGSSGSEGGGNAGNMVHAFVHGMFGDASDPSSGDEEWQPGAGH